MVALHGDLGAGIHAAFSAHCRAGAVLLIGTDCPVLEPAHLQAAARSLAAGDDVVIVPAEDGGYVLVGLNRPRPDLFTDMPWSTAEVMAITRERARDLALGELDRTYAACVRRSLPQARMSQTEFDIATDFAGQFGCATWSASSMRRYTAAGQYAQACESYKLYKLMPAGRRGPGPGLVLVRGAWKQDCSYPGNRICAGVWTRQLKRYEQCANGLEEFRQIRAGGVE